MDFTSRERQGVLILEIIGRITLNQGAKELYSIVRRELEAAGFAFDAEADFLRNPDDPRTQAGKSELDERAATTGSREKALTDFHQELAEYNAKIDAGETMKNSVKPLSHHAYRMNSIQ